MDVITIKVGDKQVAGSVEDDTVGAAESAAKRSHTASGSDLRYRAFSGIGVGSIYIPGAIGNEVHYGSGEGHEIRGDSYPYRRHHDLAGSTAYIQPSSWVKVYSIWIIQPRSVYRHITAWGDLRHDTRVDLGRVFPDASPVMPPIPATVAIKLLLPPPLISNLYKFPTV